MSGGMIILLFMIFILSGLPIAVSMGLPAAIYLLISGIPISVMVQRMVAALNSFPLLAVPLFIMAAGS